MDKDRIKIIRVEPSGPMAAGEVAMPANEVAFLAHGCVIVT